MTAQQIQSLADLISAIIDAVRVAGTHGAPAGTLYAAMMGAGCTLNQFNGIMGALVRAGKLRQEGFLYFAQ